MTDISDLLKSTMQNENCSSFCAFLLFTERTDQDGIYPVQPKPIKEVGRRLCDTGDKQGDK